MRLRFSYKNQAHMLKMNRNRDNILNDIINDHKKKRNSTSARKCEESDHDDMIDVLLNLQETSELELNITNNHIKAITLIKVNFDATVKESYVALATVCRKADDNASHIWTQITYKDNSVLAVAMARLFAIDNGIKMGFSRVIFEGDAKLSLLP
uniref:Uncharacterized protein n=1 Tax=Quercus lobata TaxID=97700 RepID=A0A7N2LFL2_QUELO